MTSDVASKASGGYQANHVAPVIEALQQGLSGLPAGVDLTILGQGPFPDTQPRDHEHVKLTFNVAVSDLSVQAQATINAHSASSDSNRDLYGDALDHGSPLSVVPNTVPMLLAYKLANGSPAVGVNTVASIPTKMS